MKTAIAAMILTVTGIGTASAQGWSDYDDRWRGRHYDRVIVQERPNIAPIVGILLLGQIIQEQQKRAEYDNQQARSFSAPAEPKLRRESPVPMQ